MDTDIYIKNVVKPMIGSLTARCTIREAIRFVWLYILHKIQPEKITTTNKKKFLFHSLLQFIRQNAIIQLSLGNVTDNVTGNVTENDTENVSE